MLKPLNIVNNIDRLNDPLEFHRIRLTNLMFILLQDHSGSSLSEVDMV